MGLTGQTILVTGATGANGPAICASLAKDGAQVMINAAFMCGSLVEITGAQAVA